MTAELEAFRDEYQSAFSAYIEGGDEAELHQAYELGRAAITRALSVLDLAAIHHDVLVGSLGAAADPAGLRPLAQAGSQFLVEVLSTYEMVQRGFVEAQHMAKLEQQHAEQLRRLAEASVAIHARGSIDDMAARVCEHAVRVLGVASATVTMRPVPGQLTTCSYPPRAPRPADARPRLHVALVRGDGSSIGELEVSAGRGRPFTDNDEAMLTQLARLAGVALENAELYHQERVIAETLQRRLLPDTLPAVPGVTLAWRYLPGWVGSDIGGDWYDAIELPQGRVAFVVGDVMGKGVSAAAGMGQVRIALRAYAIEGHAPGTVMRHLDEALEGLEEELATAVYLVYDPDAGTLTYANAGHPPPLLVTPEGDPVPLDSALAPPLGSMIGISGGEASHTLDPGDTLLLYTDGLIERRGADIDRGLNRLRAVVAAGDTSDLDAFCDDVLAGMDADGRGDDIALLAVRVDGP